VDPSATAADQSDRACCCPAKAVVQVVLPPTATRPRVTDLLLCGHHYRVSRRSLAAAHAVVRELPGMPRDTAAWIYDDHDHSPAPAGCANLSGRTGPESAAGPAFGPAPKRKARTMKHIKAKALTVMALGICVALLAGSDDIRKFHRMRSM
jgi:hypothetical protein